MRILITGSGGYIGNSMKNHLKENYEVTTITRGTLNLLNGKDVNNFFADKYYDVVLNCAAVGVSNPRDNSWNILDENLIMYYNLLANRKHYGKFIHFGSGAELYFQNTPYGLSKKVIRNSIVEKDNFYNLRVFAVFDENELNTRLIKSNILRYIAGDNLLLFNNKKMDFFYMQDLFTVVEHYISKENLPKEFNCVYEKKNTVSDILNFINSIENKKVEILIEGINDFQYTGPFESLNLNYVGLEQGIKNVYQALKNKK